MIRSLDIKDLSPDPWSQFDLWYADAMSCNEISYPHAFTLSTLNYFGYPEGRVVLMKERGESYIVFYTNFLSNKGKSISRYPRAGASFYWDPLGRQVRLYGNVKPVEKNEADEYFHSRSRESQIGAWASSQSEEICSRAQLEGKVKFFEEKFKDSDIPRPAYWSGFKIYPISFEFWQFGEARLHNRFKYELKNSLWIRARLQP